MDKTDPIERVREARRRISGEHADTRCLIAHYEELQKRHADRLIDGPESVSGQMAGEASGPSSGRAGG